MLRPTASLTLLAALAAAGAHPAAIQEGPEHWRQQGQDALSRALSEQPNTGRARNVVLFIGDGMGVGSVTAARILEGQLRGEPGEENALAFEQLPYQGMARTYNTNQQTPDSAGTMSAIVTGVKTRAGMISVDQRAWRADCASSLGRETSSLLEEFEREGRATGVVTTARLTHATPAATYAHSPERDWESDAELPAPARDAGCKDIARQLLEMPHGDGLEVALGGGRTSFLPQRARDPEYPGTRGRRLDGRDLTREWLTQGPGAAYVWNLEQFQALDPNAVDHLLGLFEPSHMKFESDRQRDAAGEPSLAEMTRLAIQVLSRNPRGFFLMVEGGRIDHAHHLGNAYRALHDTVALAQAVEEARRLTRREDTLLIVTADHSHVFTLAGYPTRGNPILGPVIGNDEHGAPLGRPALATDGLPYTTAGYHNGLGFAAGRNIRQRTDHAATSGRHDLRGVDTAAPDFYAEALVPLATETHSAEDVAIYADGPWAHLFQRTEEQSYIYHVMRHASDQPAPSPAAARRGEGQSAPEGGQLAPQHQPEPLVEQEQE